MDPLERHRAIIEALSGPLNASDGTSAEEIGAGESRLGITLPGTLRSYYLTMGRHRLNGAHNRLLPPEKWFIHDGRLVFMEENQAVLYWSYAISEASNDPMVSQGVNLPGDAIDWHCQEARCAEFLLVMLCWQAVCGGLKFMGMTNITSGALTRIRAEWPLVGTLQGGMLAFMKGSDVACVIGEGEDDLEIFAAARTQGGFNRLDRSLAAIGVDLNHA